MKLIVDSGSTKTDYVLLNGEIKYEFNSMGFNPFFHDQKTITKALMAIDGLVEKANEIKYVYYYGAGCSSEVLNKIVFDAFQKVFTHAEIEVNHDLHAAAIATCGSNAGIACILGTGSNSCYFTGAKTIDKIPALGYILGDEGSGTYFGKKLLAAYFYRHLPKYLEFEFENSYKQTKTEILRRIYSEPDANVYLASFTKFIGDFKNEKFIEKMLVDGFRDFLSIHVKCFDEYKQVPTHFIGSVAYYFQHALAKACEKESIKLGKILQKPMPGLIAFHK